FRGARLTSCLATSIAGGNCEGAAAPGAGERYHRCFCRHTYSVTTTYSLHVNSAVEKYPLTRTTSPEHRSFIHKLGFDLRHPLRRISDACSRATHGGVAAPMRLPG